MALHGKGDFASYNYVKTLEMGRLSSWVQHNHKQHFIRDVG
jgi:hypothetical protein